ncbi:GFA family protein [Streptomyces sp. NPDC058861]|uniref:GFA family protein n=1 Tax=Streptomyces sp. NPDC058861 TaxID=3346653 RepID=UPI0036B3F0E1
MTSTSSAANQPAKPARRLPRLNDPSGSDLPVPVPMPIRTGHCACGRISYRVNGIPDDPHLCSCERDTRVSGGPAVLWVGFPKDSLTWTNSGEEPKWWNPYPDLRCGFCPDCGSQLVSEAEGSDMVMVTGFSLSHQDRTEPVGHSYREKAAPWMDVALAPAPIPVPDLNLGLDLD